MIPCSGFVRTTDVTISNPYSTLSAERRRRCNLSDNPTHVGVRHKAILWAAHESKFMHGRYKISWPRPHYSNGAPYASSNILSSSSGNRPGLECKYYHPA